MPIPMSAAQIADDIEERIRSGEYKPGTKLPSRVALAGLYSVGTTTMDKVMVVLRERRLVVGVQGLGVYVAETPP